MNIKSTETDISTDTENTNTKSADAIVKDAAQMTADYLTAHPDFFTEHSALLASLDVSHDSGSAISLIERQVGILREQNAQHKSQLAELVSIAKDNEQSNQKMHKLTLSLLACSGIDACEVALDEVLCDEFTVDAISLKLFSKPIDEQPEHLFVTAESALAQELEKLLNTRKPMCGFFKKLPLEELFESKSDSISSVAVIPLFVEKNHCFGALILGSNNIRRFNADMGTLFLERLGEILSHKLSLFFK
ncbi:DUF484 family protein [sulfur-oxidizing endosymbiont of Gigantopelta aegis]|uniref:DUF484 family protein n=1 Tax=sulfur-oxidizing endosymbiont of Gigantopelta aegis TaxID=2794934 RepID=UPI001BE4CB02|nr:DUF484 family protein [sulfur-oxidizing endosymbiont of Gigantopelta aegis]